MQYARRPRLPSPDLLSPTARIAAPTASLARPLAAGLALSALLLLGGCAIDPVKDEQRALAGVSSESLAKARGLAQTDPAKAAELYQELAKGAMPPARQQLELNAAGALLAAGDADAASRVLTGVDKGRLTGAQREQALLLDAEVALQRGRAPEAITTLGRVNRRALPADLKAQYYGTLAAAYRQSEQPLKAAATLNDLDGVLKDPTARLDNQVSLLFTLSALGKDGLSQAADDSRGRMRGWVELAELFSGAGTASPKLDGEYRKWRTRHIGHPAMAGLPQAYFKALAGGYAADTDVLVLLPQGGQFGVAGNAVRDGIQAAYNADTSGNRPDLNFRGSGAGAFAAGVEAGADLVIGPLDKPSVSALAERSSLPVPTLALNRAGSGATRNLYQFSLAPEDEAINAANFAWASGMRSAALLFPQDPWGERMADAFRARWRTLGGKLAAQKGYVPTDPTFGGDVGALLAGGSADIVFLVATSNEVRPLWSALRETDARLPVIATSHVYEGGLDPDRDAALSGLYFVDIPWVLDQQRSDALSRRALADRLPNVTGPLARLYAMGIDGYRLAPRIAEMGRSAGTFFPGETGGLSIDSLGQVRRQLALARFTDKGPQVQQRIEGAPAKQSEPAKKKQAKAKPAQDAAPAKGAEPAATKAAKPAGGAGNAAAKSG